MPLYEIHAVLEAPDLRTRNELISAHMASPEQNLARTQSAVASLRDLLARPSAVPAVSQRRVDAVRAAAVTAVISMDDLVPWYLGALGELHATLHALGVRASGPAGGIYAGELFADERGEATVFIPTATEIQRLGRVEPVVVPPPSSRSLSTPAHSPTSIGPTGRSPPTWQATRCRWTARSGSTTSSAVRTPPTRTRGGPRSAGLPSTPGRPPERAATRYKQLCTSRLKIFPSSALRREGRSRVPGKEGRTTMTGLQDGRSDLARSEPPECPTGTASNASVNCPARSRTRNRNPQGLRRAARSARPGRTRGCGPAG
jgi:hypothetical protein